MGATAFTDQMISRGYNILDLVVVPNEQDTFTRERVMQILQARAYEFVQGHLWPWRYSGNTLSATGGQASTPGDFGSYGPRCTIYRNSDNLQLKKRPVETVRLLQKESASTAPPLYWAPESSFSLLIWPTGSGAVSLSINDYLWDGPVLSSDESDEENLDDIPVRYHYTILFDMVLAELWRAAGDDRAVEMEARAQAAIRRAWADENTIPGGNRIPRYGRGTRVRA